MSIPVSKGKPEPLIVVLFTQDSAERAVRELQRARLLLKRLRDHTPGPGERDACTTTGENLWLLAEKIERAAGTRSGRGEEEEDGS